MPDTLRAAAIKPLFFEDCCIKKGEVCTVLREQPDQIVGTLLEVMFTDGVRRFVRKEDVEVTP